MESQYTPKNETHAAPRDETERAQRLLEGRCDECGLFWEHHKFSCPKDPRHVDNDHLIKISKDIEARQASVRLLEKIRQREAIKKINTDNVTSGNPQNATERSNNFNK